jgi:hypothetical protein
MKMMMVRKKRVHTFLFVIISKYKTIYLIIIIIIKQLGTFLFETQSSDECEQWMAAISSKCQVNKLLFAHRCCLFREKKNQ